MDWKVQVGLFVFAPGIALMFIAVLADLRDNAKVAYRSSLRRDWRDRPIDLRRWR